MSTTSLTGVATSPSSSSTVTSSSLTTNLPGVRAHIPIILDLKASNFTKWKTYATAMLGRNGLLSHVDGTPAPANDPEWTMQDFPVLSWLYVAV